MDYALHAATTMHTNVVTDVRVAREAGYGGVELWIPKLARYLDAGFSSAELRSLLGPLRVTMLDTLAPIESSDRATRARLRAECARMAQVSSELACPAIQVVALDEFGASSGPERMQVLVASLTELAEIAASFGVMLALEPVVFSPFHALHHAVDVVEAVGRDRVGLCLDTWHLWTSGTTWDEVANLDRDLILSVHISDTQARTGAQWRDADRTALPGDGILPLNNAINAIRATGYDGYWAVEMTSARHWEWDPQTLASVALARVRGLMTSLA